MRLPIVKKLLHSSDPYAQIYNIQEGGAPLSKERAYDVRILVTTMKGIFIPPSPIAKRFLLNIIMHQHSKVATIREKATILATFGVGC